jgi:hypothetical protein
MDHSYSEEVRMYVPGAADRKNWCQMCHDIRFRKCVIKYHPDCGAVGDSLCFLRHRILVDSELAQLLEEGDGLCSTLVRIPG